MANPDVTEDLSTQRVDDGVSLSTTNKLIPISKEEKERLLASYRLTLLIAGRGMHKVGNDGR